MDGCIRGITQCNIPKRDEEIGRNTWIHDSEGDVRMHARLSFSEGLSAGIFGGLAIVLPLGVLTPN